MTSRIWKYLGQSSMGVLEIAYRVDGLQPLCVDCERELANYIANFMATCKTSPPTIYQTAKEFEGHKVTWYVGYAGDVTLEPPLLAALAAGNCFPAHHSRQ